MDEMLLTRKSHTMLGRAKASQTRGQAEGVEERLSSLAWKLVLGDH